MEIKITPTAEPKGRRKHQESIDHAWEMYRKTDDPRMAALATALESLSPSVEPERVVMTMEDLYTGNAPVGLWENAKEPGSDRHIVTNKSGGRRSVLRITLHGDLVGSTMVNHYEMLYLGPIASVEIKYTPHTDAIAGADGGEVG